QIQRYLYERSEEGRAVRVGEKEVSEQAAIVARYADLFSREQLRALRDEEDRAADDQREWLYRLRKTCEGGLIAAELAERDEQIEERCFALREKWFERLLGPEREQQPSSAHFSYIRRLSPLESTYTKERATDVCLETLSALGFDMTRTTIRLDLDDRPQKAPR